MKKPKNSVNNANPVKGEPGEIRRRKAKGPNPKGTAARLPEIPFYMKGELNHG